MTRRDFTLATLGLGLAPGARAEEGLAGIVARVARNGSEEARAAALHDFVRDEIAFGWGPRFNRHDPEDTLGRRLGFCQTKGALMVALLREAGIEARLLWAEVDAAVLRGLIDPGTPFLDHAYVEARIGGEAIRFDSHVVDALLARAALRRLGEERQAAGWGVAAEGSAAFPGFIQFTPAFRGSDWGAFETPEGFEAGAPKAWNRLPALLRAGFTLFAGPANARAEALRRAA